MREGELSGMAAVARNFGTFGFASLSIIAISAICSTFVSFPRSLILVSILFFVAVILKIEAGQKRQIFILSAIMLTSFAAVGVSIENEEEIGRVAEFVAFASIAALLGSVSILIYKIFSPLWVKPLA